MYSKKVSRFEILFLGVVLAVFIYIGLSGDTAMAQCKNDDEFTTEFRLGDCVELLTEGTNPFFILEEGYTLVLEGEEDGEEIRVMITVLADIYPTASGVDTRVVEEREWVDGDLVEISKNYFAICRRTNDVLYYGELSHQCEEGFDEEDDSCEDGNFDGSWEAGVNDAEPGLIMPGTFLLGSKYFQEQAPAEDPEDAAMDRGENVEMGIDWGDDDDEFDECVMVVDTNPAEGVCKTKKGDVKIYCPGIGIVQDEELELVYYGYGPPPED